MTLLLSSLLGASVGDWRGLEDILIPLAVFAFIGTIIVSSMYFKHQKQRLWHDTARLALEKGQPVPTMPKDEDAPRHRHRGGDIRAGLILIATGVGLYLFFNSMSNKNGAGYIGAIPGLIGVALLLHGILMGQLAKDKDAGDPRPPLT
jgi:hypothetical protein